MDPEVDPGVGPGVDPGVGPGVDPEVDPGVGPGVGPGVDPEVDPGVGPGVGPRGGSRGGSRGVPRVGSRGISQRRILVGVDAKVKVHRADALGWWICREQRAGRTQELVRLRDGSRARSTGGFLLCSDGRIVSHGRLHKNTPGARPPPLLGRVTSPHGTEPTPSHRSSLWIR